MSTITEVETGYKTPERGPFNSPMLPPIKRHRFNPEEDEYWADPLEQEELAATPPGYVPVQRLSVSRVLDFAAEELRKCADCPLEPLPNYSYLEQTDPTFMVKYLCAKTQDEKNDVIIRTNEIYEILQEVRRFLERFDKEDGDDVRLLLHLIERLETDGLIWTPEYTSCIKERSALGDLE